jgi:Reverse transcriptase (RNA-dependent DNA polymerase)
VKRYYFFRFVSFRFSNFPFRFVSFHDLVNLFSLRFVPFLNFFRTVSFRFIPFLIEVELNYKIFAFGTFLDVEGAFDNASFDSMITASYDHTVDNMTTKWIDSMLKYRAVRAEIRGVSSTMKVRRGCPQGGVLSPLLWNMVIDSLLRRLEEQGLWAQGFADDVVILINGKYLGTVCELMQSALLIVQEWCEQVGLSVNPNKTTAILFTNKRNLNGYKTPIIFGKELEL